MLIIVLILLLTILGFVFIIGISKAENGDVLELILSKAWQNRFAGLSETEKKTEYLYEYEKYHRISEKKAAKKVKEMDKQIEAYRAAEEIYLSGKKAGFADLLILFGYTCCKRFKIDVDNGMFRKQIENCEQAGFLELEKGQETGDKRNAIIYSYYLFATLISYVYMGLLTGLFLAVMLMGLGSAPNKILMISGVAAVLMGVLGYLPYDTINSRALKRKEEIEEDFPNVVSKLTLLVISGMNISKAMEETANSGNTLIYHELRRVLYDTQQAVSMEKALIHLQGRCDNKYLDKLVSLISKSYRAGNANLASDIRTLNDECWLEKKHSSRRLVDKVQTKLFIPTMIMFVGILVVIIIPIMSNLNF